MSMCEEACCPFLEMNASFAFLGLSNVDAFDCHASLQHL